jgi:integrase
MYIKEINGHFYAYFRDRHRRPVEKSYPLRVKTMNAAVRKAAALDKQYEEGEFDPWNPGLMAGELSVTEASELFLQSRSHRRDKSIKAYRSALKTLTQALPAGSMLSSVDAHHLRPLFQDAIHARTGEPLSPATLLYRYRHLSAFFSWCTQSRHIKHNPMDSIARPKVGRRVPEYFTPEQVKVLRETIRKDYEAKLRKKQIEKGHIIWLLPLIQFAIYSGMRIGEIVSMRWSDVDLDSGLIYVRNHGSFQTKSGDERAVTIAPPVREVLEEKMSQRPPNGYVFKGVNGKQMNPEYVSEQFKKYVRKAGLPENLRFHSQRHTTATWLLQRNTPLTMVKSHMGHASVQTTMLYSHDNQQLTSAAIQRAFG